MVGNLANLDVLGVHIRPPNYNGTEKLWLHLQLRPSRRDRESLGSLLTLQTTDPKYIQRIIKKLIALLCLESQRKMHEIGLEFEKIVGLKQTYSQNITSQNTTELV